MLSDKDLKVNRKKFVIEGWLQNSFICFFIQKH